MLHVYKLLIILDKVFYFIGGAGVVISILLWQSRGFLYLPFMPLIGFLITSFLLCKICIAETVAEDAKDAKEMENYIKNHFRRTTTIERVIDIESLNASKTSARMPVDG